MSGYTAEEAIGQTPRILRSGFTAPEKFKELWDTIKAGKSWSGEFINRNKDGNVRIEQAQISPLRDEQGIITHYMGIKEDITARKEMEATLLVAKEKAEAANKAKDEFLAVMSHEMRTPMNGVIGMSRMLLECGLPPEQQEYAEIVCTCGENLLSIVDDVLSFTKIKGGTQKLELNDFELQLVLEQTATMFDRQIKHASLEFCCRIDPAIPSRLSGDVGKLRQIVSNLVGNAIKFTSKGTVTVTASLSSKQDGCAAIRFEIQDTGIGIPEYRLADIFSAFTQVDSSTTREYGGIGLGLAISAELVALMGGDIGVTSSVGKGSTFWFTARFQTTAGVQTTDAPSDLLRCDTLDLLRHDATNPPRHETIVLLPEAKPVNTPRILIAEDNVINQKVAQKLLGLLGYTADIAADGRKAVRALETINYALVLMDCMMPDMDGYEATAEIRNTSSNVLNHTVPIVAMTANVMPGDREKCLDSGMDDYMAKPVKKGELEKQLKKWLDREE
jgi:PAS domain S-box-containing protein